MATASTPQIPDLPTPVKPGWKTTEFWVTLATSIGSVLSAIAGILPAKEAGVLATASTVIYTIARAFTKNTASK